MAEAIIKKDEYGNPWIMCRSTDKEALKFIDEEIEKGIDVYVMFVGTPPPPPSGHP